MRRSISHSHGPQGLGTLCVGVCVRASMCEVMHLDMYAMCDLT